MTAPGRFAALLGMRTALMLAVIVAVAATPVAKAHDDHYDQIRALLQQKQVDEAETAFQAAIKDHPDSQALRTLHLSLYVAHNQAGNHDRAAAHLVDHLEAQLPQVGENPVIGRNFLSIAQMMVQTFSQTDQPEASLEVLDRLTETIQTQADDDPTTTMVGLKAELVGVKAQALADLGRDDEGRQLLSEQIQAAEAEYQDEPDDPSKILAFAQLQRAEAEFLARDDHDASTAKADEALDFLAEQARNHPENPDLVWAAIEAHMQAVLPLSGANPEQAQVYLNIAQNLLNAAQERSTLDRNLAIAAERRLKGVETSLARGQAHSNLIGKPAAPLDAEAWANGDPISEEDLKGKVVLIDFWAVWCGPCIATFPHLRAWHEQYADKGLVVIGTTRYYGYGWSDEAERSMRVEGISKEDERDAMEKFAEHHELEHVFMITPEDSDFWEHYGVTGIPQVVLIDREGIVRLVRVGSGDDNARAIGQMIERLITQPATAATGE